MYAAVNSRYYVLQIIDIDGRGSNFYISIKSGAHCPGQPANSGMVDIQSGRRYYILGTIKAQKSCFDLWK